MTQFLPAPKRQTPDYYTLTLADTVFGGGGFGTRLNLNLREDKGYSYGVFSTLALYDDAGHLVLGAAACRRTRPRKSVIEFDKELKGMTGKPLSESEFADTKSRKTRGYAQQFETLGRINEQIADLWASNLPMAELQREYDDTVKATLAETNAAAAKYARSEKATIVLVGDYAKIGPGLKELTLGEVVLVDTEGKPVRK